MYCILCSSSRSQNMSFLFRRRLSSAAAASSASFDVCIVGAGPAGNNLTNNNIRSIRKTQNGTIYKGFAAAMRAHDYKQRVCMVERSSVVGGTGLWNGALASKTMWEVAEQYITYRRVALSLARTRQRATDFTPLHISQVHRVVQVLTYAHSLLCPARERSQTGIVRKLCVCVHVALLSLSVCSLGSVSG
jgi:hypothetical protein